MSAKVVKQLEIVTPNKVGMLAEVTGAIAGSGVNINALCAYGVGKKAHFLVITSDNAKARKALRLKKFQVKESNVVLVDLEDKVGAAKEMADKIKDANIDLSYIYGTTGTGNAAILVFNSNKNKKAVEILG